MDYYQTLGINKNATQDEVKKAYRKLASQYHPDKGGDTAMFQKIEEAYRILSDPEKKNQYDNPQQNFGGFSFNGMGPDINIFTQGFNTDDIFTHIFGHHNNPFQRQGHNHKQLFRTQIVVSLEDAYNGKTQALKIQTFKEQKVINIEIPKGVKDNTQLKYDNLLENSILIVEFKVTPHLKFERRNNDLYSNFPISILDLITGTTIDFTTMSGKTFQVNVPPKTQPYMQLKIANQGMPIMGTSMFGDQILLLKPFMPDNIDNEITESILRSKNK